jgi:hypothetical protein
MGKRTINFKRFVKRLFPSLAAAIEAQRKIWSGSFPIYLDYSINPSPRYGWGKPSHRMLYDVINANRVQYGSYIQAISSFKSALRSIPYTEPRDPASPYWSNGYMMGLDAASLYAFPNLFGSKLYLEIGSGNSTKFVRQSVADNLLKTKIVSIDPFPRAEVDSLCDTVVRRPLETVSLDVFDELAEGDILMVDNSHRCFQNSDVTVVFLEILPRLRPDVVIYIDDIFLPDDYPPEWSSKYYSEQYLLAVLLLADTQHRYEILFPGWFICSDDGLRKMAEESWKDIGLGEHIPIGANGFWMRVRGGPSGR